MNLITGTITGLSLIASTTVLADDFVGFGPRTATMVQNDGANWVVASDLDLDGDQDVLMAAFLGITTLRNDGLGGFGSEEFYPSQAFADRRFIAEDLNGDGFPDIASVDVSGNGIEVWVNLGNGSMGPRTTVPGGWGGGSPGRITASDLDNDGDLDLVVEHGDATGIRLFLNDGLGGFTAIPVIAFPTGQDALHLSVGDVDGDGLADIVVKGRRTNINNDYRISTYINDGALGFSPQVVSSGYAFFNDADQKLIDVDLDGDLDLLLSNGVNLAVVHNDGQGAFSNRINYRAQSPDPQAFLYQIAVADINGDGFPDLAIGDSGSTKRTFVYCNDGMGGFQTPVIYFSQGSGDVLSKAVALADIDGNTTPDLITGSREPGGATFVNIRFNQTDLVEPGAFSLLGPADGSVNLALPESISGWDIPAPRFTWGLPTGFQTSYELRISTALPPSVEVFSANGILERSLVVPSGVLEAGTMYVWQVTAINSVGSTDSSSSFVFTTAEGPRLCEPDLNGDGVLDFFDISQFINAFSAGCP